MRDWSYSAFRIKFSASDYGSSILIIRFKGAGIAYPSHLPCGPASSSERGSTVSGDSVHRNESRGSAPPKKEGWKEKEAKLLHGGAIVVAPIPIVSPALGSGIEPVAGYIFPFEETSKHREPSVVGPLD
jgi:hypothetical protein